MEVQDRQLLHIIREQGDFTAAQLAEKMSLSEKTARERLKRLEREVNQNGGIITSKSGKGYQFRIVDPERFAGWLATLEDVEDILPTTGQGRVDYILRRLLYAEDFVKLDDLCDELFISRTSMTADMKRVKHILAHYRLTIRQRPGYGICIEGEELDLRNCMVYELLKREDGLEPENWDTKEKRIIMDVLALTFKENNLNASKQAFLALIYYCLMATKRIKGGHTVHFGEEFRDEIESGMRESVVLAARRIAQELVREPESDCLEEEAVGLMIQISGKGVYDFEPPETGAETISDRIETLAREMLDTVYEVHGLDLRKDPEMYISLSQHLVPFDVRMRYHLPSVNPILDQVKKDYVVAYHIAISACAVLEREYRRPIPEAEIGYFAVLFALAMERREKPVKKNILVVCVSGQASSRLFIHRVQTAFSAYVDHIYSCSAFQISKFDFSAMRVDYVFTTVPLHVNLPVPVFQVSPLLQEHEISTYRRMLQGESDDFILQYFRESLFCGKVPASTKETVLADMCRAAGKCYTLPEDFYDSVMERERMGQTDFGNLIAIPHPCRIMGTERFVSVAVLDKPIWWGHNDVQVVLLISLEQDDPNVERFYQVISEFMGSAEAVETLIRTPTFQTLLDVLNHKNQN